MRADTIQLQKGMGIMSFLACYGTEDQCEKALFFWRYPDDFTYPNCSCCRYCKLHRKAEVQCNRCHYQTSLTSNTTFEATKLPLICWFLSIYLVTQNKTGISALNLHRQLSISYSAAWRMKHKLMQVMMERNNHWLLTGHVQIDDAYWGGERHGGDPAMALKTKSPL